MLLVAAKWGGAIFLCVYGARWAWAAFNSGGLAVSESATRSHAAIVLSAFSFSLLNPHVYLDTVVLLGAVGGQQQGIARTAFTLGAMTASTLWFFGLGYGARLLAPVFARPVAWRVLDGVIALVMWVIALSLIS